MQCILNHSPISIWGDSAACCCPGLSKGKKSLVFSVWGAVGINEDEYLKKLIPGELPLSLTMTLWFSRSRTLLFVVLLPWFAWKTRCWEWWAVLSCSVMSDSLWCHGQKPIRLLCPWGFSREEYWSELPFPPLWDLPNPEIESSSPTLQADSLLTEAPGNDVSSFNMLVALGLPWFQWLRIILAMQGIWVRSRVRLTKIPHAPEQLSLRATSTEPMSHN